MAKRTIAVVCFFCHDGQGNYLLGKRSMQEESEPGAWSPGAGTLEFGESIEAALSREIQEEYGAHIKEAEFLGYRDFINDKEDHIILFDFRVLIDPKEAKNNEPEMVEEIRWATIAEVDAWQEPLHSQMGVFMDKHRHRFI